MNRFKFQVLTTQEQARRGQLSTPHGVIETPAFIPVGTQATVKATRPGDWREIGMQAVMCNTYHLYLRPGEEVIAKQGGLHPFMRWEGPLMTDSGGFQVLSLGAGIEHGVGKHVDLFADDSKIEVLARANAQRAELVPREKFCVVTDERIIFKSHLDGSLHEWTPEKSVEVQQRLGADIMFALDECTSPMHDREYTQKSLERSHRWEERSLAAVGGDAQVMYGIVQGGPYQDLRQRSARFVQDHGFFGVGIGGALVNKSTMRQILDWVFPALVGEKPVHLLGIGSIDDIFAGVERGVDTFDCADPTRIARRGNVLQCPADGGTLANRWRMNITAADFRSDPRPIGPSCACPVCREGFSRAYLHHLLWAAELTAYTLTTIHNLWVMARLMQEIRDGISHHQLSEVKRRWLG